MTRIDTKHRYLFMFLILINKYWFFVISVSSCSAWNALWTDISHWTTGALRNDTDAFKLASLNQNPTSLDGVDIGQLMNRHLKDLLLYGKWSPDSECIDLLQNYESILCTIIRFLLHFFYVLVGLYIYSMFPQRCFQQAYKIHFVVYRKNMQIERNFR